MTSLYPEWRVGAISLTTEPYLVPFGGVDYGSGENVTEILRSLLQDGDVEVSSRTGNRTVVLPVLIDDSDMAALADAEAALAMECDKAYNEVYIDPGDGFAQPFIFDVFRGQMVFSRDDDFEQAGYRSYTLTFRARPFPRSVTNATGTVTLTTVGTTRQRAGVITATGSARTEAALAVEHATSALGDVLLYTFADDGEGHSPALRQYLTSSGATTADAALVSGARNSLDTAMVFDIPTETLPAGCYLLMARVGADAPGVGTATLLVDVATRMGSTTLAGQVAPTLNPGDAGVVVPVDLWSIVILGVVSLPMIDVGDQSTADLRVTIVDDETNGINLDEAWLFNTTVGSVTQVSCDTAAAAVGGPSKRLFVEPPSLAYPSGRLLRGHSADKSDAFHPGTLAQSWGRHMLRGGADTGVFVVTTNASAATVGYEHAIRWHTHAGL